MSSRPPPPFLSRIASSSSSTTHTRSPAKFARKPAFSVKREEIPPREQLQSHDEGRTVVTDADAQLLLGLHLSSAPPTSPSITSPASRVSIASLVNAFDVPISMRPPSLTTPPHSAPPRVTSFSDPPVHQLRARSASPRALVLPPLALAPPGAYAPEIVSAVESRATRSMSISVEPESAPMITTPIRPAPVKATLSTGKTSTKTPSSPPVKSSSSSPAKPSSSKPSPSKSPSSLFKLGKPRGRVSKGPKKREGKGWIIESCTTSGAPSDDEIDPKPDSSALPSAFKSSPESSAIAARLAELSRDVFGGDSDMSDLSSDSDEAEEYDLGLAGLPALPVSSESEYEPGLRGEMGGDKRARRRGVNYRGASCCCLGWLSLTLCPA
ncbi:hypothetical protein FRC08_016727 [Ceratobasidium sp. 394]|nr:hypothetical protein FRC08_016727 [Ceratobasidium sp. 394]